MDFDRKEIISVIKCIEEKAPITSFVVNSLQIWPWMRVKLFFFLINLKERNNKPFEPKKAVLQKSLVALKYYVRSVTEFIKFLFVKEKRILFVSHMNHREAYKDISFIKQFDPLREIDEINRNSLVLEYSDLTRRSFHGSNVFSFFLMSIIWRKLSKNKTSELVRIEFNSIAEMIMISLESSKLLSADELNKIKIFIASDLYDSWLNINQNKALAHFLLKKIQPKVVMLLCYYSDKAYAINLAAREKGITTYDYQHGPINEFHLAYSNFPLENSVQSSKLLPEGFLVWDEQSVVTLNKSFPGKKVFPTGNVWFDFLRKQKIRIETRKKVVLYALQPESELGPAFPWWLVEWIYQSKSDYFWLFRFHPRSNSTERKKIEVFVKGAFNGKVEYDFQVANNSPLPIILSETDIAISYISGVLIEAAHLGIPGVAFHKNAEDYFHDQIENGIIYNCSIKDFEMEWDTFIASKSKKFINARKKTAYAESINKSLKIIIPYLQNEKICN